MKRKKLSILAAALAVGFVLLGCGEQTEDEDNGYASSENVIITETGEILQKQPEETETPQTEAEASESASPESGLTAEEIQAEYGTPEAAEVLPEFPEHEQVITEEDQIEPTGNDLQIVFLGDSIFDNNRDGTGVPYLTAVQCEADVYNLAIAGTSASIELTESYENDQWTSRSLVGIVKAMKGEITTDVFEGSRTKEILDNKSIDWSATDYFVVEYGINDFFKATPLSIPEGSNNEYDFRTYVGALRYAVSNLQGIAPDATIILCGPHFCQFYNGSQFIGDSNTLNTGYGTLFDYKGICQYVANERGTLFLDAYFDLGIDSYTADQYLEDGVHLTEEGRHVYADALAQMILKYEETKNN